MLYAEYYIYLQPTSEISSCSNSTAKYLYARSESEIKIFLFKILLLVATSLGTPLPLNDKPTIGHVLHDGNEHTFEFSVSTDFRVVTLCRWRIADLWIQHQLIVLQAFPLTITSFDVHGLPESYSC